MHVVYTGPADVRVLAAEDLKKANVDGFRQTSFVRGEVVEVPDNVGDVLIANPIFGNFSTGTDPNAQPLPTVNVPSEHQEALDVHADEQAAGNNTSDFPYQTETPTAELVGDPLVVEAVEEPTITELPEEPVKPPVKKTGKA